MEKCKVDMCKWYIRTEENRCESWTDISKCKFRNILIKSEALTGCMCGNKKLDK